jgi:hypothetical protein
MGEFMVGVSQWEFHDSFFSCVLNPEAKSMLQDVKQ